jgi:hypothetical protein
MDDAFDDFLRDSLTPAPGPADRAFVARVQTRITLDERWRAQRSASFRQLAWEMTALSAVAAAILTLSRVPEASEFLRQSPAAAFSAAAFLFALFLVPLVRRRAYQVPSLILARRSSSAGLGSGEGKLPV